MLLVDDDRTVLDALAAELQPVFGDVCRIEAFTDPESLLAMLSSGTSESREVAVAIVDQRMPGTPGTELIARLRETEACSHLRAILLTGYAGLDSALEAKNLASVDRYLEKPWLPADLHSAVRAALSAYLTESRHGYHYVFREIDSKADLAAMLRLRYEVYAQTPGVDHVLPARAEERLDVDAYDTVSRFFGLMARQPGGEAMIGTLRVAGDQPAPAIAALEQIVAALPALHERLHAPRREALPLMTYLLDRDAVAQIVEQLRARGERVVEPGRLTLDPAYRGVAPGSERHLARHIIDGAVAFFFFFFRIENAILTCIPPHDLFYRPYGFRVAEGTTTGFNEHIGAIVACLHGTIASVPLPARERCTALATRIARGGGACRCASFPECLGGPYETGDFGVVDVFCPLVACERV